MAIADCADPDDVLNEFPCLNCMSIHQLWVILMGMFAVGLRESDDMDAVKAYGAKFAGITEKQFLIALISSLPATWFSALDTEDLTTNFGCATCWSESEVKNSLIYLWCTFWSNYTPQ